MRTAGLPCPPIEQLLALHAFPFAVQQRQQQQRGQTHRGQAAAGAAPGAVGWRRTLRAGGAFRARNASNQGPMDKCVAGYSPSLYS